MDMPDKVRLQYNQGWKSCEEVVCGGTQYTRTDLAQSLADALEDLISSGVVPSSTAKDGGPNAHSAQVMAANKARAALKKYRGE